MDTKMDFGTETTAKDAAVEESATYFSTTLTELDLVLVGGGIGNTIL